MKYAVFNDDRSLKTCLIEGVHAIPAGAVALSDELFLQITQEVDGIWTLDDSGAIVKKPKIEPAPNLPMLIADTRYRYETAGITLNGVRIDTGRDSQGLITGATLSAMLDPTYVCTWKTVNGPVVLTAEHLIGVAIAVRAHVQACFDRETQLLRAVANGTYVSSMLNEGWPS